MSNPTEPAKSNWVTLVSPDDVYAFLSTVVVNATNETIASGSRIDIILDAVVMRFRGAISTGGRVPLSEAPKAVPPEAKQHVLILVAEALISSMPQAAQYVSSETFGWMIKNSRDFLKSLQDGMSVTYPSDPDDETMPTASNWGDGVGTVDNGSRLDLTTD